MEESFEYNGYTITRKFLQDRVNYIVTNRNVYQFTLVPKEDGFVLSAKDKKLDPIPSESLVKEIADFIFSYNE